jgi:hypothetical protein
LASAGEDQEITVPESSVLLLGQGSDLDGDSLVYRWSKVSGRSCTFESPNTESCNISGLVAGNYYIQLEVSDGYEVSSDRMKIVVKHITVGTFQETANKLEVYPIPVSNLLVLNYPAYLGMGRMSITNAMGQLVFTRAVSTGKGKSEVDISELEAGIYLVNLDTSKGSFVARIIKTNKDE